MNVIVLGAGIAGLSTAWSLVKAGHNVSIVEQGPIPNPLAASGDHHRIIRRAYGKAGGYGRLITEAYQAWDDLWADLGEIRTLAVAADHRGRGHGAAVLQSLIEAARELGLSRLFALTFQTGFFGRHGFVEIEGTPVDQDAYDALRRSYDPGVAEFLGLEYVKPNTLGNTRMLRHL